MPFGTVGKVAMATLLNSHAKLYIDAEISGQNKELFITHVN